MEAVLRLEGPELDANLQGMWRILLDHTCSVRATAQILEDIAQARRFGKIDYCLVIPVEPRSADAATATAAWTIHVVQASL